MENLGVVKMDSYARVCYMNFGAQGRVRMRVAFHAGQAFAF
jgi:hypothetical protein